MKTFGRFLLRRHIPSRLVPTTLFCATLVWLIEATLFGRAEDSVLVGIESVNSSSVVLQWHSKQKQPLSGMYADYEVQCSSDLKNWQAAEAHIAGKIGASEEAVRHAVAPSGDTLFYRVLARTAISDGPKFPDAMYGYAAEFASQIADIGQMPLETFVEVFTPTNQYRTGISFDPTTATFWAAFNTDPAVYNLTHAADPRLTDFRFNDQEFSMFATNGFMVSQRLGSYSFADAFYKVYIDDLPVYISTDALLHAWHRSYVAILEEIEEAFLAPKLNAMVHAMADQIPQLYADRSNDAVMINAVADADYFLAVAKSLVTGTNDYGRLGQASRVSETLSMTRSLTAAEFPIFGANRIVDFSQLKVRGHYANTLLLQRYFRAMMWCSIADFRFTGKTNDNSLREFSGAVALNILLDRAGQRDGWLAFDQIIRTFVGPADCLNFAQLGDLVAAANLQPPFSGIPQMYANVASGDLGVQQIRSGYFFSPWAPEKLQLPRSFAMMPQRFLLDSWAQSKVVFDDIIWDEDGIPGEEDKVLRRVPSGLDVAFTVLANDQIVPELAARIADKNGVPFRDGYPYQHNLAAVRAVIDNQDPAYWTNNIYTAWLGCLRTLSRPTATPEYPQSLQTRSWALSSLNTQLASWTELRHDTILYGKQPYTAGIVCGYPASYVEPRPDFWQSFGEMAVRTKTLLETLPPDGSLTYTDAFGGTYIAYMPQLKTNWTAVYDRFANAAAMLKSISEKELTRETLSDSEIAFLQDVVERHFTYTSGPRTYSGWYPNLFYRPFQHIYAYGGYEGSDMWDALVTDVHTDVPAPIVGDPGCVLHEAVGTVNMAFIVVDCGNDAPNMYAGPVFSHYEFQLGPTTRQSDSEWKSVIRSGAMPSPPAWTKSFLVQGAYVVPPDAP
jgi:hypothetical protein